MTPPPVRFTAKDACRAYDEWGANCGPGAIAAIAGLTLDELRPRMGDFERRGYTNPTLMWQVLDGLGLRWRLASSPFLAQRWAHAWPRHGLARVQWEGPWTRPGVPPRARYRHTHWIGAWRDEAAGTQHIFDINAMVVGGWITAEVWGRQLVPWLLKQCEPKADGGWHLTHVVEVEATGKSSAEKPEPVVYPPPKASFTPP